jgi:hypothetical protein
VDTYNDPLPDLAIVQGSPRDYAGGHPTTAALVVEVSDTTLRIDLTEKAERYPTALIADYWVLDLTARQLRVLRNPKQLPKGLGATAYSTQLTFGPTDRLAPLAAPQSSVLVGDLLP